MENKQRGKNINNNGKKKNFQTSKHKSKETKLDAAVYFDKNKDLVKSSKKIVKDNIILKGDNFDSEDNRGNHKSVKRKPVWHDDEDNEITVGSALKSQKRNLPEGGINDKSNKYKDLLKNKFISTVGSPAWASLNKRKEEPDSDEEILKTCGHISNLTTTSIPKGIIQIKRVKNLNAATRSEGPYVKCVEFHPTASAALVAGISGIASLFAVDGRENSKLHSVAFSNFPIHCAKFVNNCREILFGSPLPFIYSLDLETSQSTRIFLPNGMTQMKHFVISPDKKTIAVAGRFGEVHILESFSRERLATLKQETEVTALTYSTNGKHLFGHGMHGRVTVWDTNTMKVCHHWYDDGCVQGSAIAYSASGQFVATGSYQGAVNVYEADQLLSSESPIPQKTVLNLTTPITNLQFNSTSELLAFSSSSKDNAVKLLHVISGSVYSNFPEFKCSMNKVETVNFSPNNGYLALSNNKSTVVLYRLKHYNNY